MPTILSRSSLQSRRKLGSSSRASSKPSLPDQEVWMTPVDFNHNRDSSFNGITGNSSISSDRSTPSMQKAQSASSSMRRTSSMTFDDYQNEELATCPKRQILPPRYPTTRAGRVDGNGDTWGHFVDVASEDEALTSHSHILSSRFKTLSMNTR